MEDNKVFTDINSKPEEPAMPELSSAEPEVIAECIHSVLYSKKGRNVKTVKVDDKTIIADYFVLCSGTSRNQVRSLADILVDKMKEAGIRAIHMDGANDPRSEWVAVDFGAVIVHIFTREMRDFYDLDRLYGNSGEIYTLISDDEEN